MLILSCDIGATNTRTAVVETVTGAMRIHKETSFSSTDFQDPRDIITHALDLMAISPNAISLGVAGPVRDQCCEATNLPWRIDGVALQVSLKLRQIYLLNDLEAIAWGIPALKTADYLELHQGCPDPNGNLAIVAAGTGLGKAGVCRRNGNFHPFPSEGGHTDFAPSDNPIEIELLRFFAQRHGHVSWERVVSGLGIPDILHFLCQYRQCTMSPTLRDGLAQGGGAGLIAAFADTGQCPLCEETMDLFVCLYGRAAGNHALSIMASGGVYLAGGIVPKILPRLQNSKFLAAFFDKGRMQPLMRNMPIRVILNDRAALYGAAQAAINYLYGTQP